MHFYERIKQKFGYIYIFVQARRFYCFLNNFPNVGYDILERGYRFSKFKELFFTFIVSLEDYGIRSKFKKVV